MGLSLILGSRHLCGGSLAAWLVLRRAGLRFDETVVVLGRSDSAARMARLSPSGGVPVLLVNGEAVAGPRAIADHAAASSPALWPKGDQGLCARRVAGEACDRFGELSAFLPMDLTARFTAPGFLLRPVAAELAALLALWKECRALHSGKGPFLFGEFGVVDAMMAPWAARFITHGIPLAATEAAYVDALQSMQEWKEWERLARSERGEGQETARPTEQPLPASDRRAAAELPSPSPTGRASERVVEATSPRPAATDPSKTRVPLHAPTVPSDLAKVTPGRRPGAAPIPVPETPSPKLPFRRAKARDTIIAPDPEGRRRRTTIVGLALGLVLAGAAATIPRSLLVGSDQPVALLAPDDDASVRLALPRVVVRYAQDNAAAYEAAEHVALRLSEEGYRVAAIEPSTTGVKAPTIRYFSATDRPETIALANQLQVTLQRQVTAMLVSAGDKVAPTRPGTLEIWLGSLNG